MFYVSTNPCERRFQTMEVSKTKKVSVEGPLSKINQTIEKETTTEK